MSRQKTKRTPTDISLPDFCLVVLIGASGSGKSTFAARHFRPTEIISSDWARGAVSDDESDQSATGAAFELVHFMVAKRLQARRLTVIDATNVRSEDRREYVRLARRYHALPVAIVVNPPEDLCHQRNAERPDRQYGPHVVRNHVRALKRGIRGLQKEGFRQIYEYRSTEDLDAVTIERVPLWTDRRSEAGPFDLIGDVHGCCDELQALLEKLGYDVQFSGTGEKRSCTVTPPPGRRAIFVGDLVDRGPRSPDVLRLVMQMVEDGTALCVNGNHDDKFRRFLEGKNVKTAHGLDLTIEQMQAEPDAFRDRVKAFLTGLISHYWLDGGALAVAHAGLNEDMLGRASGQVRAFAMYGDTTGETDEFGLPVRYNWAADYRGKTAIIYGHTPVPETDWLNGTLCIDTGCVFGGKLTALRWPERELVSVPAAQTYAEPARPLGSGYGRESRSDQAIVDDMLDIDDVRGKRIIETRLFRSVTIAEAHSAAALEAMSRFAIDPKWLAYLPPTMSPSETSTLEGLLEHPAEAFAYFRNNGVETVICEEKHMGSRAVIIVCRDNEAARRRFGIADEGLTGTIHTRTGRAFFAATGICELLLARLRTAMDTAGFWDRFETDWAIFDAELMPWSAKARGLLLEQYAPVGTAATLSTRAARSMFETAAGRGIDIGDNLAAATLREKQATDYIEAWQGYCWDVNTLDDYRIAPFHLLATEDAVHMDKNHVWHMQELAALAADDPVIMATPFRTLQLSDEKAVADAVDWWTQMTESGGEGMVVKPLDFITRGPRGLVQPALKCRGRNYLRIIYGPEYDSDANLTRLRRRGLGAKRGLAGREFALGYEALSRFVDREPLRRVHECVFGVLALESEPVDPRL